MLAQTIISLITIIALTIAMSFMLVKIVRQVNKRSKNYFEKKIIVYDELIDKKEKQLSALDSEIENKKEHSTHETKSQEPDSRPIVLNEKLPNYKVKNLLKQAKIVNDKFNLNKEAILTDFIEKRVVDDDAAIVDNLTALYAQLKSDDYYARLSKGQDISWDSITDHLNEGAKSCLHPYIVGNPDASLSEILSYLELEIDKHAPEIVVETGDKTDKFEYIYDNIKTIYNPDIYMGIRIFYQDRMYDYSLKGEL